MRTSPKSSAGKRVRDAPTQRQVPGTLQADGIKGSFFPFFLRHLALRSTLLASHPQKASAVGLQLMLH